MTQNVDLSVHIRCSFLRITFDKIAVVLRDRSIDHRLSIVSFYSIDTSDRQSRMRNRRELSRNIAEFSMGSKRIITTSVRGAAPSPDNSTVIRDHLPPFVVYIFITNIRKVLPHCIVRTRYGNARVMHSGTLSSFMPLNARIKFNACINLVEGCISPRLCGNFPKSFEK